MKNFSDSTGNGKSTNPSNRRDFIKKASMGGLGVGFLGATASSGIVTDPGTIQSKFAPGPKLELYR